MYTPYTTTHTHNQFNHQISCIYIYITTHTHNLFIIKYNAYKYTHSIHNNAHIPFNHIYSTHNLSGNFFNLRQKHRRLPCIAYNRPRNRAVGGCGRFAAIRRAY